MKIIIKYLFIIIENGKLILKEETFLILASFLLTNLKCSFINNFTKNKNLV